MPRTIVVANQKGGVGKTTTVANLGAALASRGRRILLADLDPQAALTATFGVDPYTVRRSLYGVLMNHGMSLERIVRPTSIDTLSLAPASVDLARAEHALHDEPGRSQRLREAIQANRVPFDYILIDTPPSLSLLTLNGLVAADEVLVPVQTHYLAMRGVRALMEVIWRVKRRLNPDLRLLGLLPTMHHEDSEHAQEVIREMRKVFKTKVFPLPIVHSVEFAEAPVTHRSLVEFRPDHEGAVAYRKLAEVIDNHG